MYPRASVGESSTTRHGTIHFPLPPEHLARVLTMGTGGKICLLLMSQLLLPLSCSSGNSADPLAHWMKAICKLGRTRALDIYGIFQNGATQVAECFEELSRGIGETCEVALTLNRFSLEPIEETEDEWRDWRRMANFRSDQTVSLWRTNVIVLSDVDSLEKVFDENQQPWSTWKPRDLYIVFLVSEQEDESSDFGEIERVLKSLWLRRQIQNVLLSAPLSATTSQTAYSYDPFARIGQEEWGRVETLDLNFGATNVAKILPSLGPRRLRNLNGYTLSVGLFKATPSIGIAGDNGTSSATSNANLSPVFDVDGFTLSNVAAHLNFRANIKEPDNGLTFGYQRANGTYVGTLGDVVYGRVNISFVSFFIKHYGRGRRSDVDFTTSVEFDRLCIVVPKALKVPKWARIYYLFEPSAWLCFGLCHLLVHLAWYFFQIFDPRRTTPVDLQTSTFRAFLLCSGCPVKLPGLPSSQRILLIGAFFASVTIPGLFSGVLYKSFARDMYYPEIDTLTDLDKSALPITYGSHSLGDIFDENDEESLSSRMMKRNLRSRLTYGHGGLKRAADFRNTSALIRKNYFPVVDANNLAPDGTHKLHLATECPRTYYLAYLLPKNSILRDRINGIVGRLNQAGLPDLWSKVYVKKAILSSRRLLSQQTSKPLHYRREERAAFRLTDVHTSFYTLVLGLVLSTLAFLAEKASQNDGIVRRIFRKIARPCAVPRY